MRCERTYRIYTVLSKELTFLGLTLDEWMLLMGSVMCGLYLVMHGHVLVGAGLLVLGVMATSSLKKFKKLSVGFSLKSALYMSGYWPAPSKFYPKFDVEIYAK
tara:strand:- start:8787 stop:9095 length:309 start_codon:yes stop_codon:yes gene_type:complete